MQFNRSYLLLIGALLLLAVGLIYWNIRSSEVPVDNSANLTTTETIKPFNYEAYVEHAHDTLTVLAKARIDSLEALAKADTGNYQANLLLASAWEEAGHKLIAAHYYMQIAERLNTEGNWNKAGLKYYEYATLSNDSVSQMFAVQKAIDAYQRVVEINPENLEAKNEMALCYVQNDLDVMRGVQLLLDIVKRDSNNVKANYSLGMLSRRSGQWEKARMRFEKLTRLDPASSEAYFYLGEALTNMGRKKEAISAYESSKSLIDDPASKQEIDKIIEDLKK